MKVAKTPLKDCFVITDTVFEDSRGYFFESFNKKTFYNETGLNIEFVQDNQSRSAKGVLRGLHFQSGIHAQSKLIRVLDGHIYDVVVDLRKNSPTFMQHFGIELNGESKKQLFIPKGFAHGFLVLSESCTFFYKCDNYYNPQAEKGILYNDPDIDIKWPLPQMELTISAKDVSNPLFKEIINELE